MPDVESLKPLDPKTPLKWICVLAICVLGPFMIFLLCYSSFKFVHRYQQRADANNRVHVVARQVKVVTQQIEVQKKQAQVEQQIGRGQKLQNEEIARKLTPLFVQYGMIQALDHIATSGTNNSIVYIPVGANGVPLVSVSGQPQVFSGNTGENGGK